MEITEDRIEKAARAWEAWYAANQQGRQKAQVQAVAPQTGDLLPYNPVVYAQRYPLGTAAYATHPSDAERVRTLQAENMVQASTIHDLSVKLKQAQARIAALEATTKPAMPAHALHATTFGPGLIVGKR